MDHTVAGRTNSIEDIAKKFGVTMRQKKPPQSFGLSRSSRYAKTQSVSLFFVVVVVLLWLLQNVFWMFLVRFKDVLKTFFYIRLRISNNLKRRRRYYPIFLILVKIIPISEDFPIWRALRGFYRRVIILKSGRGVKNDMKATFEQK